jgi:hypothetical protein
VLRGDVNATADITVPGSYNLIRHDHANSAITVSGANDAVGPGVGHPTIGTNTSPDANYWRDAKQAIGYGDRICRTVKKKKC